MDMLNIGQCDSGDDSTLQRRLSQLLDCKKMFHYSVHLIQLQIYMFLDSGIYCRVFLLDFIIQVLLFLWYFIGAVSFIFHCSTDIFMGLHLQMING